jgi:FkbM family methyltransferase
MRDHLRLGATILDVGANIGLFTVEGAQAVGPSGKVIAIEAMPFLAEQVRKNALLNKSTNVEIVPFAVGDADGEIKMTLPKGAHYGMFTAGNVEGDEHFSVQVRRIDDLLEGRRIDFIKMDIEGSEFKALSGAAKTISEFHPPILIELNESALRSCGSSARQVKECLFSFGYGGWMVNTRQPISLDQNHDCDECLFLYGK